MTNSAIKLIAIVGRIQHIQARYHLLRWSANSLLLHLGRLVPPQILQAYATQFLDGMEAATRIMLATENLTAHQLQMIRMPTKHAGLGLGGPAGLRRWSR